MHQHRPLWLPRRRLLRLGLAAPAILAFPRGARAVTPTIWDAANSSFLTTITGSNLTALSSQIVYTFAADYSGNKHWVHNSWTGKWNDDVLANQNPATGTGGYSPASLGSGPFYPAAYMWASSSNQISANFGAATITELPSGFSSANTAASATVTWDTSWNTSGNITYSNGNLTAKQANSLSYANALTSRATHGFSSGKVCWEIRVDSIGSTIVPGWANNSVANTNYMHEITGAGVSAQFTGTGEWAYNNANSGVKALGTSSQVSPRTTFATNKFSTGKLMWEATVNFALINAACGFGNASALLTNAPGTANSIGYTRNNSSAQITNNGSNAVGQDAVSNGSKMGWYVDFSAQRAWYYIGDSSNRYNSSPTADPATNTGGYDISAIISTGLFPIMGAANEGALNTGPTSIVGNFSGGFTVPVPSGFVAWDSGTSGAGPRARIILGRNSPVRDALRVLV